MVDFKSSQFRRRSGFTLVELLVVISIILIAASIILVSTGGGDGVALSSSQRIVSGIAQGARGQAILKNADTRLIIHNDPSEPDKNRRFFGIVYADTSTPAANDWIAATQGTSLPEGIYFDAGTSNDESGSAWSTSNEMSIDYPKAIAVTQGQGTNFLYYGFNSNGTSRNPNAYLVLRAGTMIPNSNGDEVSELRVEEEQTFLRSALIFRRAGNTTLVTEPSALDPSSPDTIN